MVSLREAFRVLRLSESQRKRRGSKTEPSGTPSVKACGWGDNRREKREQWLRIQEKKLISKD